MTTFEATIRAVDESCVCLPPLALRTAITKRIGTPLIHIETTTSTMDEVDQRARSGAAEGLAVVAERQTAGRGRAKREWRSDRGSAILCSLLLRPPVRASLLGPLPLIVGLAISEAIEEETGLSLCLKWPNDLVGSQGKIGGVLLTSRLKGQKIDWVTVGFGINVNGRVEALPQGASSLQAELGRAVDRSRLLHLIFTAIDRHYGRFEVAPEQWDRGAWISRCCSLGDLVRVEDNGRIISGVLLGVDTRGGLQLQGEDGRVETVVAGDLVRGPRTASTGDAGQNLK